MSLQYIMTAFTVGSWHAEAPSPLNYLLKTSLSSVLNTPSSWPSSTCFEPSAQIAEISLLEFLKARVVVQLPHLCTMQHPKPWKEGHSGQCISVSGLSGLMQWWAESKRRLLLVIVLGARGPQERQKILSV